MIRGLCCNDKEDKFKWFYKYFHLGRFPPVFHRLFEGKNSSVLDNRALPLPKPPATSKACLKYRRQIIVDILTCSPLETKDVQAWRYLGVARSGMESMYFPSELYLGQKYDDEDSDDLNTCPPSHARHFYPYNPQLWGILLPRQEHMFPFRYFGEPAAYCLQLLNTIIINRINIIFLE